MALIAVSQNRRVTDYLESVRRAGGDPVEVADTHEAPEAIVARVRGVMLTGGGDVDPVLYGEPAHASYEPAEAGRDAFEIALARTAVAADVPLLAICRGMQVLNVALGGSMHQHLPERSEELVHSSEFRDGRRHPDDMWQPAYHQVTITDPTLAALAGADQIKTNSYHHQGVAALGEGLSIAARASDGLVEAIVGVDRPLLGVQWHPEMHTATDQAGIAPFRWLANRLTTGVAADEVLALN
jgi:putative glutamine amidotransferase